MNTLTTSDLEHYSRREFLGHLQRGGLALFWLALIQQIGGQPPIASAYAAADMPSLPADDAPLLGRVLDNNLTVYARPSFSADMVNVYYRDLVYPINAATIGDRQPAHNRVWYRINNEGYVHSGQVQPVQLRLNTPLTSLPASGQLAEVSVPFTDARRDPNRPDWPSGRLYYSSTHWAREAVTDQQGQVWYRIADDKYRKQYYVDARHLRPIPPEECSPITISSAQAEKHLEVRLNDQLVIAYEGGHPVWMTRTASGGSFSDGDFRTPPGQYFTSRKRPSRHMAAGDLASPSGYDLPGVPWVTYLTLSGISFHGTYWHNDFGQPRSHGCLNLSSPAAHWLYRWSQPSVPPDQQTYTDPQATRVDIV